MLVTVSLSYLNAFIQMKSGRVLSTLAIVQTSSLDRVSCSFNHTDLVMSANEQVHSASSRASLIPWVEGWQSGVSYTSAAVDSSQSFRASTLLVLLYLPYRRQSTDFLFPVSLTG